MKMEDPLRPKAVPLSTDSVMWFEFLLDPNLLTNHLSKQRPEPSALDLLSQFISMVPDTLVPPQYELTSPDADNLPVGGIPVTPGTGVPPTTTLLIGDGLRISRKQMALKILALKVATRLKWNLDVLERALSIPKQLFLLRDLCTICFGKFVTVPLPPDFKAQISMDGNENAARFALTVYHRWVLRLQILKDIAMRAARPSGNMFVPMEPMHQFFAPEIPTQPSIEFLQELCKSAEPFYIVTYDTFEVLHCNNETTCQTFPHMQKISTAELRTQILYDLVNFYLYTKQYHLAREAIFDAKHYMMEMNREYDESGSKLLLNEYVFCHVSEDEMQGYLLACGRAEMHMSLTERFSVAPLEQYKNIIETLEIDNQERKIPLVSRRLLELDMEAAISQGTLIEPRSFVMQVAALNVVRSIFEPGNIFSCTDYFEKYAQMDCCTPIIKNVMRLLTASSMDESNAIKQFLIECTLNQNCGKQMLQQVSVLNIFASNELADLEQQISEEELVVPALATQHEWKFNSRIPRIEVGSLERQLISCSNANTVRKLLVKLAATNPTKPLWTVNPSWEIATPIKSLLMSMPRGFLQDFSYVLLGKARELTAKNDYIGAVSMLSVLKSETQRQELSNTTVVPKLGKLVNWEILLIQITQCLDEWNRIALDLQSLNNRCKQCLSTLQSGDNIIPRTEIIESCAMMLLNLGDWNALMLLGKRLPQLELPIAFATTILDMEKMKGSKKVCRDAFDLVLSMFQNNAKRAGGSGGTSTGNSRGSPCLAVSIGLQPFLKRIRHQLIFSLAISMLGKIQNVLRDDTNHDLNGEYMQLWPTGIVGPMSYNVRSVSETLHWLLTEALKYYPQTITWLKMKGDLELAIGNNEAAMRCYVNALITGTEYCTFPLQRNIGDDYIVRKMIRCSSNLGCHMQATVLCQFLEEIDYGIVFKKLTEKSSNFTDAMDAYYNCIWDTTLLEFIINLHAKKGEHSRKLDAIAIMGSLELNANNNEEIKREAVTIRKMRFLRALAKQYLL